MRGVNGLAIPCLGMRMGATSRSSERGSLKINVQAYNNVVVSTTNYGIAIEAGHNETFYDNTIISSGLLPDGQTIYAQNVGACIWNLYGTPASIFYNNSGYGNVVGWVQAGGTRNDWWIPNATSWTNNNKFSGVITLNTEASELAFWRNKLATGLVTIGSPLK